MKRSQPIKRSGPPKKRNPKRRRNAFFRAYESEARVQWVKTLPCVVPFCHEGPIENAHTGIGGGMGYKGPSSEIFPCCQRHHHELHAYGLAWFEGEYGIGMVLLRQAAEATEIRWRAEGGEYDV